MNTNATHRQKVLDEVSRRGLVSMMNNTKWQELRGAVCRELAFGPPFQLKQVLESEPHPASFSEEVSYLGDWSDESLFPFYSIEWMRIRPRYWRRTSAGRLETPSVEAELLAILQRFHIPLRRDEETIWIYGYASAENSPS